MEENKELVEQQELPEHTSATEEEIKQKRNSTDKDPEALFSIGFDPEVGRITFKGNLFKGVKQKSSDWIFYKLVTYIVTKSIKKSDLDSERKETLQTLRGSLAITEDDIAEDDLFHLVSLLINVHEGRKQTTNALNLDGTITKFLNPGLIIISGTSNTGKTAVLQKICSSLGTETTPLISIYEPQIDIAKIMAISSKEEKGKKKGKKQSFSMVGGLSLSYSKIAIDSLTEILLTVPPGYATNKGGYSTPHIKSQLAILDCYCSCTGATVIATLNTLGPIIEVSVMDAINSVASLHVDLNAQKIHYRTLTDRHTVSVSSITINDGESIWLNSDPGFVTTSIKRDGQTFFIESEGHYADKEVSVSQLAKDRTNAISDFEEIIDPTSNFSSIVVK